jgi:hypothetical protein
LKLYFLVLFVPLPVFVVHVGSGCPYSGVIGLNPNQRKYACPDCLKLVMHVSRNMQLGHCH